MPDLFKRTGDADKDDLLAALETAYNKLGRTGQKAARLNMRGVDHEVMVARIAIEAAAGYLR